jgi:hypothetical protein
MMKYEEVKALKPEEFRRLTGVKHETFVMMLGVLEDAEAKRKGAQRYRGGKKPRLTLADQLMMTLCYLREYRTQFHVSKSYGLHETHCGRIIRHVEDTLMKSREFTLPGRKAILASNIEYEVVVIDATETPIERPQKNSVRSTRAKRNATR